MFTPPEMIMFETRSARYRYPSASRFPTSPRLLQPLSFQAAAVLAGSPWYSKRLGVSNHNLPCPPGASSSPSGPTMCTVPSSDLLAETDWDTLGEARGRERGGPS